MTSLRFLIDEGANRNFFVQDSLVNLHAVWRTSVPGRLIFAFPEENSGVGVELSGALVPGAEAGSWGRVGGLRGGLVEFEASGTVTLGRAILDTVRTLRDWRHPDALAERLRFRASLGHTEPRWTWEPWGPGTRLWLEDLGLTGKGTLRLEIELPPGVTWVPGALGGALVGPGGPWSLGVRAGHDLPSLHPLGMDRLLSGPARTWAAGLGDGPEGRRIRTACRNLAFQVFEEKVVAGSWQYLTYFGRDTLLTSLLLGDSASLEFHEVVLRGVFDRLGPDGRVAHEEDIGEQIAYRGASGPVYDYKMVDDDFLLLPCLAALEGHPEASVPWIRSLVDRYREPLERNARWCLGRLDSLVPIDHPFVGDWRDSHTGLGGGVYANSVNCGLVPAFLDACRWYSSIGGRPGLEALDLDLWADVRGRFRVVLGAQEVRRRLGAFLSSSAVPADERRWMASRPLGPEVTVGDWVEGRAEVGVLNRGLAFSALSLDRSGAPVAVVNSDFSFRLFLGHPDLAELEDLVTLCELPFPLGLAHPVGFLVANPALSGNADLWSSLDRHSYHGTVVWGWQDAMVTLGLARQARRADLSPSLRCRLEALAVQARAQRETTGSLTSSELWTWSVEGTEVRPQAFGAGARDETESNAIQLWSSAAIPLARLG